MPATCWRHPLLLLLMLLVSWQSLPAQAGAPAESLCTLALQSQVRLAARQTSGTMHAGGDADRDAWRRAHKVLRVGVVGNYLPPFDLVDLKGDYRGISADYLAVVIERLGVPARIFRYPSHELAHRELASGAIDLITTSLDKPGTGLRSTPYHDHRLIEVVSRRNDARSQARLTIGYLAGEVSVDALRRAYPGAALQPFENLLGALDQLSRHGGFMLVTSAIAAGYLVEQHRYHELSAGNVAPLPPQGVAFAVGDATLGRIVDRTLATMPASLRHEIDTGWAPSSLEFDITDKLNLSVAERAWIARHPAVRYLAIRDLLPLQFIDTQQHLRGLTEQVLQLIAQRTGLRFEPYWPASGADIGMAIENGALDIVPILPLHLAPTVTADLSLSAPYYSGNWVVVTRAGDNRIKSLPDLADKVLAGPSCNGFHDLVRNSYPVVQHETDTYDAAFGMVATGRADATIANAFMADHMLRRTYAGQLKVAAPTGGLPLEIGMGVSNRHPELLAIVNKAILGMSRDELGAMRAHWTESQPAGFAWRQFLPWLLAAAGTMLLVSLLFLAWVTSLRRQVTQRTAAERALQDQVAFQTAVLDGIPQPIYLRDDRLRMITCNTAYETALGTTRRALAGTEPAFAAGALGPDIGNDEMMAVYRRVLRTCLPFSADRRLTIAGVPRNVISWVVPLRRADGGTVGLVGGWIDVTERQQMLAELAAAKNRAEAANRAKSTFLASISHEIRTPMNAILGMLELVLTRPGPAHGDHQQLGAAHGAATSLLSLLDDILDLSKMEAGKFTLQPRAASLRQGLQEVVQMFRPVATQKGLQLNVSVGEAVAGTHCVDILRIKQVVGNFLSNAIRFTERGSVDIRLDGDVVREARQNLDLVIRDTGIGIAPDAIGRLFRPFSQVEAAGQANTGGTGLGLSIAQSLVHKMGGKIALDSEPGRGTQVTVRLSLEVCAARPGAAGARDGNTAIAPLPVGGRVLIVDDHAPNRLLLAHQLERLGVAADTAENGALALEALQHRPPDLILCDCMMPVMDGFGLARAIRARSDALRDIPIVGCTASAQHEDHQQALAAGMSEVLVKPVGLAALERALRRYLSSGQGEPQDPAKGETAR